MATEPLNYVQQSSKNTLTPANNFVQANPFENFIPQSLQFLPKTTAKPVDNSQNYSDLLKTFGAGYGSGSEVNVQGGDIGSAAFDVLGAGASGAVTGAAIGLPAGGISAIPASLIGGAIGLSIGLGKAYFSVSAARKKARYLKVLARQTEEANRKAIERSENWLTLNRNDSLREKQLTRSDLLIQQGWTDFQNQLTMMNNFMGENKQAQSDLTQLLKPSA